jgi:hypothetical protein
MLARTTPDACNQRLLKGKHVDRIHLLEENLRISQLVNTRCHSSQCVIVSGTKNAKPKRYEPLLRGLPRAQAILTPVSDPTPTAEKVRANFVAHGVGPWLPPRDRGGLRFKARLAFKSTCFPRSSACPMQQSLTYKILKKKKIVKRKLRWTWGCH